MLRITILTILVSIFTISVTTAQVQNPYNDASEKELIETLQHIHPAKRYYSAKEIKRRLGLNEFIIKKGNIIEHTKEYWEDKTKQFLKMGDINILLDSFEITTTNLTPNYDNIKVFRLDHFFVIRVQLNKNRTKGKVIYLYVEPESYSIEPPPNYTGLWKIFQLDGTLRIETSYKKGIIDGFANIYYQDGSVCWSKLYINGEIQYQRGYSLTGEMTSERIFDDEGREQYRKELEYESSFLDN